MEELSNTKIVFRLPEATDILQFSCYVDVACQQMKPTSSTKIWVWKKIYWFCLIFLRFLKVAICGSSKRNNIKHPSLKKSHAAPICPNQDLVIYLDRSIHPLSWDIKKIDVEWLWAEIKGITKKTPLSSISKHSTYCLFSLHISELHERSACIFGRHSLEWHEKSIFIIIMCFGHFVEILVEDTLVKNCLNTDLRHLESHVSLWGVFSNGPKQAYLVSPC